MTPDGFEVADRVEDFMVLACDELPVAGCMVYEPDPSESDRRNLRLERLPQIAEALGWPPKMVAEVRSEYEAYWSEDLSWLAPQAPCIIETVGVLPEARGRGLGRRLIEAAIQRGRALGHTSIGIMVINGNEAARQLYESCGFEPVATFHAAYFDGKFPGVAKMRRSLQVQS